MFEKFVARYMGRRRKTRNLRDSQTKSLLIRLILLGSDYLYRHTKSSKRYESEWKRKVPVGGLVFGFRGVLASRELQFYWKFVWSGIMNDFSLV